MPICLAHSSLVEYISNKSTVGPKIHITDCHNNQKSTKGCYQAIMEVEDNLPHPIKNKPVNIHITESLSYELILGADFLKENDAIINVRENAVTILPEKTAAIGNYRRPTFKKIASLSEGKKLHEELTDNNNGSYVLQSTEKGNIKHMDHITFRAQLITEPTSVLKPGTTQMITSDKAPASYFPDGLYGMQECNLASITVGGFSTRQNDGKSHDRTIENHLSTTRDSTKLHSQQGKLNTQAGYKEH